MSGSATSFSFTEVYDSDGIANNGGVEANNNNFCGPRSYQISSTKIKKLDGTAAPTVTEKVVVHDAKGVNSG